MPPFLRALLSIGSSIATLTVAASSSDLVLEGQAIPDSQWRYSAWYGYYAPADSAWIYHLEHGWQYIADGEAGAAWAWDPGIGDWTWIQRDSYPWVHSGSLGGWGYYSSYSRRATDPRWFYRAVDGHWINDRGDDLDELVAAAWIFAENQMRNTVEEFDPGIDIYPYHTDTNGRWLRNRRQDFWTAGYFPACMWYLYAHTGDEEWLSVAEAWTAPLTLNHNADLAVRYFYSYGRGWQLTGSPDYWSKVLESVEVMIDDWWVEDLKSFQSWERDWSETNHAVVTDLALHTQPFFVASRVTGELRYEAIARAEIDTIIELNIREDGSTIQFTDLNANGSVRGVNNTSAYQGYRPDPLNGVWSRAQAWAVMALPMAYRYTGDQRYLDAAHKVADYFIQELPEDQVPPSSFRPKAPNDSRDSSAAAIAAVGLRELAIQTGDARYENVYRNIILSLSTDYLAKGTNFSSILIRGCHRTGTPEVGTIYGDCFFLEALLAYDNALPYVRLPE